MSNFLFRDQPIAQTTNQIPIIHSLESILFNTESFENTKDVDVFMVDDDDCEIDQRLLSSNPTTKMTKG
jgi:hypothetical protein